MEEYIKEWWNKAEKDLKSAKILMENDASLTDIVCYLCQQSVEKQLKTFLVAKNKRPPKRYNIAELLKLCIDIDESFVELEKIRIQDLTIYATGTRYPDDSVDISVEDAQQAIAIAEKVKAFVSEKIKR